MFSFLKQPAIFDRSFESMLTYEIAIPTDEEILIRMEGCRVDLAKRGLSITSPRGVLEKDKAGSLLLDLYRIQQLRGILYTYGWRKMERSA
jgi:hypothetical protein